MRCSENNLQLITSRLILRPVRLEDFDGFASTMAEFASSGSGYNVWVHFRYLAGCWHLDGFSKFSVLEKSTGRYVGFVGPLPQERCVAPEIGWNIIKDQRGRGYATEAAFAVIEWVFKARDCNEIVHYIAADNHISQSVAGKLGSHKGGPGEFPAFTTQDVGQDVEIWGQSREQWHQARLSSRTS